MKKQLSFYFFIFLSTICQEPLKKKQKVPRTSLVELAGQAVLNGLNNNFKTGLSPECHAIVTRLFLEKNRKEVFPVRFPATVVYSEPLSYTQAVAVSLDNQTVVCAQNGWGTESGQIAFLDLQTKEIAYKNLSVGRFLETVCIARSEEVLYGTSFGAIGRCPTKNKPKEVLWEYQSPIGVPISIHTIEQVSSNILFGASDGALRIVNPNKQEVCATFDAPYYGKSARLSSDKEKLAGGYREGVVKLWDIHTQKEQYSVEKQQCQTRHLGLFSLALCLKKQLIAAGYGSNRVHFFDTNQQPTPQMSFTMGHGPVQQTHFLKENYLLGYNGKQFVIWDIRTAGQLITGNVDSSAAFTVTHDSDYLIAIGNNGLAWDLEKVYNMLNGEIASEKVIALHDSLSKAGSLSDEQKQTLLE